MKETYRNWAPIEKREIFAVRDKKKLDTKFIPSGGKKISPMVVFWAKRT